MVGNPSPLLYPVWLTFKNRQAASYVAFVKEGCTMHNLLFQHWHHNDCSNIAKYAMWYKKLGPLWNTMATILLLVPSFHDKHTLWSPSDKADVFIIHLAYKERQANKCLMWIFCIQLLRMSNICTVNISDFKKIMQSTNKYSLFLYFLGSFSFSLFFFLL